MFRESLDEGRSSAFWNGNEYCFTTGQFAKLDRAYRRHCGPTAITNLVYTLAKREGIPVSQSPEAVFRRIAGIGRKRLIYMNADFLKRFGGTSDFLVPLMIRRSLRAYGLTGYSIRGPSPLQRGASAPSWTAERSCIWRYTDILFTEITICCAMVTLSETED